MRKLRQQKGWTQNQLALKLQLYGWDTSRESVTSLRVRNLAPGWGLRGVVVKGGKTRDIPLPSVVIQYLEQYVENVVAKENGPLTPDTPFFWSSWGRPRRGKARTPMSGKNIWRLCKTYGRPIG